MTHAEDVNAERVQVGAMWGQFLQRKTVTSRGPPSERDREEIALVWPSFLFFFRLFIAAPAAYGSSQARG